MPGRAAASLPAVLLLLSLASCLLRADEGLTTGPAKNWALPLFTPEGFRSMTLRGSEVYTVSSSRIDIINMNIAVFSGDASVAGGHHSSQPGGQFFPARQPRLRRPVRPTGPRRHRRDRERWTYDYNQQKVSIQKNLRVAFRAQLTGILK